VKEKFTGKVRKPLIYLRHWYLSHTMRRNRAKNRIQTTFTGVIERFPLELDRAIAANKTSPNQKSLPSKRAGDRQDVRASS
jgi:hypothetical protein